MVSNILTGPSKRKKATGKKGATEKTSDHLSPNNGVEDPLQDPLTESNDTEKDAEVEQDAETDVKPDIEKGSDADKDDSSGKGDPTDDGAGSGDPNAGGDPKGGDPKGGDPKGGDPKGGDPKGGDPKGGDPKGGDPKGGDPKGAGEGGSKGGGGGGGGPAGGGDTPDKKGSGGASAASGAGSVTKDKGGVKGKAKKAEGVGDEKSVEGNGGISSLGGGGGGAGAGIQTVNVSPLAPPTAPTMFSGPSLLSDPGLDAVLVKGTGLGVIGHQAKLASQASQLSSAIGNANNLIATAAMNLSGTSTAEAANLKNSLGQLWGATQNTIGLTFGTVSDQVEQETEAVKKAAVAALAAANNQVKAVTGKAVEDEKKAFDAAHGIVTKGKSQWDGDYKCTVKAQADRIREMGKSYEAAVKTKESGHRSIFKAKGSTGSASDAIPVAQEKAKADAYKAYQPEFGKYAKLAAMFLDNMAEKAVDLSDKLMLPTLNDLYPLAEENKKTMSASATKLQAQIDKETQGFEKSTYAIQKDQVSALKTGEEDATAQVDDASANLEDSTDTTVTALNKEQAKVAEQVQTVQNDTLAAADEVGQQVAGTPDAEHFEIGKIELIADMERDNTRVVNVMGKDQERTMRFVAEKHDSQKAVIKGATQTHATQVKQAGATTVETVKSAGANVLTQTNTLMVTSDKVYDTLGKNTADQATKTGEGVDATSKEYQTTLLAQLDQYVLGADKELRGLVGHADSAAMTASELAKTTQKKALTDRAGSIYKAIDGWGTDESTLIKNLTGLTWSEASYTAAHFQSLHKSGTTLKQAIIDDTSPGDNVRESCLAYLKGDQTTGAKYALKYASEGIWRVFGTDMDLANSAMTNMNEESRTKLLNDPAFPAIKENLTRPRMQLSPAAMVLSPGMAAGSAFFGNSKYELDTFAALSDKTKTLEQAKEDVEVINLAKAFDTDSMNPFKQGTDEAQVFAILGKLEGEALEKFKAKFKKYKGVSLETEIKDEFQGMFEEPLEYKRALALADGDKSKADAFGLELALNDGKEKDAFTLLEDPNLQGGGDWLQSKKANQDRAALNDNYEQSTNSTISADIDTKLADEGENATDIAQSMLLGQDADPRHLLAYAIICNGTDEAYAQKAINQLLTNVQKLQKEEETKPDGDPASVGKREWNKLKFWFEQEHNITNLEAYLGVDDYMYGRNGGQELDGQEKQDFNDILMQITSDPNSVLDTHKRLRSQWEWYRGKGAGWAGNTMMDMYSDSGGDLDHKLEVLDALIAKPKRADGEGDWYDKTTGKATKDCAEYTKWEKYTGLLENMGKIYKEQRDTVVDGICTVITTIAAIVSTIVTLGGAAALWAGVLITAAGAAMAIAVKASVKGASYGTQEAMTDVAKLAGEAITSMLTAGLGGGKFKQFGEYLKGLGEKGISSKILAEILKSAPGEVQGLLANPDLWTDQDKIWEILGSAAFKVGVGSVGGVLNENAMDAFEGPAKKVVSSVTDTFVELSSDLSVLQGDNFGMELLTGSIKKLGTKFATAKVQKLVATKLNAQPVLTLEIINQMKNISDDAAEGVSKYLNEGHQLQLYKELPKKFPAPEGAQLILFPEETTKKVSSVKGKENANPSPNADTKQIAMDFGDDEAETGSTPTKTASMLNSVSKNVTQNTVKSQGAPAALSEMSGSALASTLQKVDGVGPVLSKAIVDHGGPFNTVEDLQQVEGVGPVLSKRIFEDL
jgi:DNA uptake protein ComE-like DNA-binding protein